MLLKIENNWHKLTYYFNGNLIDCKKGGEVELHNGDIVPYESIENIKEYNDMGINRIAKQHILMATIIFNRQKLKIKLKELDILKFL